LIDAAKSTGRLAPGAARTIAPERRSAVAEERDRASPDIRSPSPHDDIAEADRRNRHGVGRDFGDCARSGAEEAETEDGAPMRVDAVCRGQHGALGPQSDRPEARHIGAVLTG